jgi:DNA-binding response OmpR family regulator
MRALVRAQLLEHGYNVRAWPSFEAARAHLLRGGEAPELIVLDLRDVDADAHSLFDLWHLAEEAPLLLCAGTTSRHQLAQPGLPPAEVLPRPFRVEDVVAWVQQKHDR